MKLRMSILMIVLALCLSAAALAEPATVTVTGLAQVTVATDHAVIHMGVRTKADTPSEAQTENKQLTDAVMKALTDQCGIAAEKIATSNFSIYSLTDWSETTGEERQYYQVMHQLTVTVDNIDQAGSVIDICVEAGANVIDYVSFESSGMKEAYDQALREAIADAKRKAELIADACGKTLGGIKTVSTNGSGTEYYDNTFRYEAADLEGAGAGETKLAPGTQNSTAAVTVTWEME